MVDAAAEGVEKTNPFWGGERSRIPGSTGGDCEHSAAMRRVFAKRTQFGAISFVGHTLARAKQEFGGGYLEMVEGMGNINSLMENRGSASVGGDVEIVDCEHAQSATPG